MIKCPTCTADTNKVSQLDPWLFWCPVCGTFLRLRGQDADVWRPRGSSEPVAGRHRNTGGWMARGETDPDDESSEE